MPAGLGPVSGHPTRWGVVSSWFTATAALPREQNDQRRVAKGIINSTRRLHIGGAERSASSADGRYNTPRSRYNFACSACLVCFTCIDCTTVGATVRGYGYRPRYYTENSMRVICWALLLLLLVRLFVCCCCYVVLLFVAAVCARWFLLPNNQPAKRRRKNPSGSKRT